MQELEWWAVDVCGNAIRSVSRLWVEVLVKPRVKDWTDLVEREIWS